MAPYLTSYMSPKLEGSKASNGRGIYAREDIARDELLVVWGGRVVTADTFQEVVGTKQSISLQIEENLFLVPTSPGPADRVNHCCSPNAGMSGQIALVAMRDIVRGEEVCYDYAMSDGTDYDEFDCRCRSESCRGRVAGDDWRLPQLQQRYDGYFSPYLERRIRKLDPRSN